MKKRPGRHRRVLVQATGRVRRMYVVDAESGERLLVDLTLQRVRLDDAHVAGVVAELTGEEKLCFVGGHASISPVEGRDVSWPVGSVAGS